ncbi:Type I secretion system ATPase [hydrothermal vent metagenome]|uniref:Type I secretion system ATPase n=1 Tax=hydrothermal vent metagenome TaxID=652676 RepID=A0A3B0TA66_9ZZZZ
MTPRQNSNTDGQLSPALTFGSAFKPSIPAFISVGFFSFFINLLMLTGPLFMLQIYDRVLASRSLPTLVVLFVLVAGLFAVLGVLEFVRTRILVRIGAQVDQRLSRRVFDGSMRLSLHNGANISATAPLLQLGIIQQFLSGPALSVLFDAPWVPVYIYVIFLLHQDLGLLAIVAAIVLFVIALLNDMRSRKPAKETSVASAGASQIADTGRRNAEVLAAMAMLRPIRERWAEKHNKAVSHGVEARDRTGTLGAISKSLRLFFQSAMLAAGAALVIYGQATPGVMIAASIILGRALQPVEQSIVHWRSLVQFRQAAQMLRKFLQHLPPPAERMALPAPTGRIDVLSLHVGVPGERRLILKNINFALAPGEILGVIGPSAAGKSSLARALVGVRKPLSGEIRLDGATFDQWHPDQLGKHIGYLPQDVELFEGTIKENIARFESDPDPEAVIRAATRAGIHQLIMLWGGYDTNVGNLGSNLSAGQRQRVALARALYGDPAFIVLDEPNSNLDEAGEMALAKAVAGMRENKQSVIIITHRMNILSLSDYLLELNAGVQTQFGPRDQVIANIRKNRAKNSAPPQNNSANVMAMTPVRSSAKSPYAVGVNIASDIKSSAVAPIAQNDKRAPDE